jgi:hypothetical protein
MGMDAAVRAMNRLRIVTVVAESDNEGLERELWALAVEAPCEPAPIVLARRSQGHYAEVVVVSPVDPAESFEVATATLESRLRKWRERDIVRHFRAEVVEDVETIARRSVAPSRVLRMYRGNVAHGDLAPFLETMRADMSDRLDRVPGISCVAVGATPPVSFVAISTWDSWESLATATRGNLNGALSSPEAPTALQGHALHFDIVRIQSAR